MRDKEAEKLEPQEMAYNILLLKMLFYKQQLHSVTLFKKKNTRGRLVSNIVCYLTDNAENTHAEHFRLCDERYLWFICALQQDFPDVPFYDLNDEENERGE